MSAEEKQNSQTYQGSNSIEYPENEKDVSEYIRRFYKSGISLELIGSGSKRKIGKPLQCEKILNLSKLSGIIEYLPTELYIKVRACTPINQIEEELKKNKQQLVFEPIDFGYLFLGKSDYGTAAGHVACNVSGPRRFKVGSVRDHVIGFRGVNGKGEIIKSGGNVVKNVTGYDLCKLICGSYGTLAALTEITFKVLPAPNESETFVVLNLNLDSAADLLAKALSSSNDVSGAVFLPNEPQSNDYVANVEEIFSLNDLKHASSYTAIRIEGPKNSVDERIQNIISELNVKNNDNSILKTYQSEIFWKKVKNLEIFSSAKNNVARIVLPPSYCTQLLHHLEPSKFRYYVDWGGALIWLEICELTEKIFEDIRKKVVQCGGHISMIKLSDNLPYVEEVFTVNKNLYNISQNIKKSFDPKKILNPGKMYTGI